ncbi:MAG: response regulator [Calditrichaeota bacterium]|nr:response regulator [Calditrichota bacterium]
MAGRCSYSEKAKQKMNRPKILIVDDIPEYLAALVRALQGEWEVVTALSLSEAKTKIDEGVSLLLVDICLDESRPGIDRGGIEVLKWCREQYPAIPVVMMSAYRDFDAAVACLNLGAAKFLKKPIDIAELRSLVRELTG